MNEVYEKLVKCYESVKAKIDFTPQVALILGSGLGDYADQIDVVATLDYKDIEGFPVSTVPLHKGRFVFGYVEGVPVVIMQGRVHYYEGYSMTDVVLPTRLMKMMGAQVLFLTNASGGIKDHISCCVRSPLLGANIEELGTRFPDMSHVDDEDLQQIVKKAACSLDIPLKEGVYVQLTGPAYETPAEINMCRMMGADAVGMSTACEAQAAKHMGMKVVGISCISNLAAGISPKPLTHAEITETADAVAPLFKQLLTETIKGIAKKLA